MNEDITAKLPHTKKTTSDFENSPLCAYAPGKQAWKASGNYFTAEELRMMTEDESITLLPNYEEVLSAD